MSVTNQTTSVQPRPKVRSYLNQQTGLKSWIFTLDHKRIGILYMVFVLTAFLLGGIFAELLRTFLLKHDVWMFANNPVSHAKALQFYNTMFSLHGAVMVFMFMIPAIPAILGNFILPMMLGAKDVAFPRLNLLSLYCYFGGAIFFAYVLLSGVFGALGHPWPGGMGLDTGWTFYVPYSTTYAQGTVPATMGAFILGFSSILTGVNFITSIHTLRAKGMTWMRMPLFLWSLYATSIIQILATPVLAITLLLLTCERTMHIGIFNPHLGGDALLYQHFFWFYSHPAVYIMILPAMGIISEVIAVHSRKHIFGYNFIAGSSIALALFGFLVWGHHLFASGQSPVANMIFSLLTFSVAIPSAVKVFNWLATLYKGEIRFTTPMLFAMGFILLFTIGGLTGLFLGALQVDIPLHDTYFVIAHFHYVMMGSTLFAFLAGMFHWYPKMFGKMYSEAAGRFAAIVTFIGFNITFFPQFIAGSQGMPRRWATYPVRFEHFNQLSTIGAYIMGFGLFTVAFTWLYGLRFGKPAPANPWGGNSLEWHSPSPPPTENFLTTPVAEDPYHMEAWEYDPATQSWRLTNPKPAPTH